MHDPVNQMWFNYTNITLVDFAKLVMPLSRMKEPLDCSIRRLNNVTNLEKSTKVSN